MLGFRLKAFERFKQLKNLIGKKPKYSKIDYQDLYYYSAPKSMKNKPNILDELDSNFQKLIKNLEYHLKNKKG